MATAGEAASPAGSGGGRRRRVLLFPVPFQGHLTPMLQLAGALHARGGGGLGVTVFYAAFNAPDPARHPAAFRFVPVGEGVPSADLLPSGSDADFAGALLRLNDHLREPFRDRLRQALAEEEEGGGVPGGGLQPARDAAGGGGARRADAGPAHRRRRLPRRLHGVPGALRQGPPPASIPR